MKRINQTLYRFENGEMALTVSEGKVSLSVGYSSLTPDKANELGGILSVAAAEAESQLEARAAEIEVGNG